MITAYIMAYNEETKIRAAVESVLWADEVLVVDSGSTDRTAEIARSLGARVEQVPFTGFGSLRNSAVALCAHEWIFSLDSDERCTPEARDEILAIIKSPAAMGAYFTPRRNYFMGRWMKHCGWYPDYRQPQLFRKGYITYSEDPVHETFTAKGPVGKMKCDIWQIPFENLEQLEHKANRYSTLGAGKHLKKGTRGGMVKALVHGVGAFMRTYVVKRGFLDGWPGFVLAIGSFEGAFFKYAKLTAIQRGWNEPPKSLPKK